MAVLPRWQSTTLLHSYRCSYGQVGIYKRGHFYELVDLEVFRGKRRGRGTKLVKEALRHARGMNIPQLHVTVSDTVEAYEFWKRFGIVNDGWLECERV